MFSIDITNILCYFPSLKDAISSLGKFVKDGIELVKAYLKTTLNDRPFFMDRSNKPLPLFDPFGKKPQFYPLRSINKFTPINIIGRGDYQVSSEYTMNINSFKEFAGNYIEKGYNNINNFFSKYHTFNCKVNLVSGNKTITVDTTIIKGQLTKLNVSCNWDFFKPFSNCPSSEQTSVDLVNNDFCNKNTTNMPFTYLSKTGYDTNPTYTLSSQKKNDILVFTDPKKTGYDTNLVVSMESHINYDDPNYPGYDDNINQVRDKGTEVFIKENYRKECGNGIIVETMGKDTNPLVSLMYDYKLLISYITNSSATGEEYLRDILIEAKEALQRRSTNNIENSTLDQIYIDSDNDEGVNFMGIFAFALNKAGYPINLSDKCLIGDIIYSLCRKSNDMIYVDTYYKKVLG